MIEYWNKLNFKQCKWNFWFIDFWKKGFSVYTWKLYKNQNQGRDIMAQEK